MNVLIAGLGSIARKHIQALRTLDDTFNIYAFRSTTPSLIEKDITNIYSLEDVQGVVFDFAIISNPTSEHQKTIELLLALSCPLFIEKPVCHELSFQNTIEKVEQKQILTYVACNLRFLSCLSYVKKEIESKRKRVNEVNVYCGSYLPDWRPNVDFRTIYSANADQGGGVHIDLIHDLDYIYWFFGEPFHSHSFFSNRSSLNIRAYDYANYCMAYDLFSVNVVLNYYRREPKRTLELVFEDETWLVDLLKNNITSGSTLIFESDQKIIDTYTEQLNYFVALVKDKQKSSFNSIQDAYHVLKICLENDTQR